MLVSVPATAPASSPAARLVYSRAEGATSCPEEASLREAVSKRFGYDPFFPWAERTVVVQIQRDHGRFRASVQVVDASGVLLGTRTLESEQPDCGEVFDATALAISIALDATSAPVAAPVAEPSSVVAPSPPAEAGSPVAGPPSATAPPIQGPPAAPPARPRAFLVSGVDGLASFGTAPQVALGGAIYLGARLAHFSAALEMRLDAPATSALPNGQVTAWLYAGALVPCAHYAFASVCAVGALGSLQGTGQARVSSSASTLFAAVGGRVGAEWDLTARFGARLHVDVLRNLAPTTLTIDRQGWTASALPVSAAIGLFLRFP